MPDHRSRILAIDLNLGAQAMAFALFAGSDLLDYAVKPIGRRRSLSRLLGDIETATERLLIEKTPSVLVIEKALFSRVGPNALTTLAFVRVKSAARYHGVPVHEIAPSTVRTIVCGRGHTSRRDLAKLLVAIYPELRLFVEPNRRLAQSSLLSVIDAVGCGLAYVRRQSSRDNHR